MDKYTLYVDGAYQHQKKIAVIAGILFKNGEMIDFFSIKTDKTNNDFEAFALLYGLKFSQKYTTDQLEVISDSQANVTLMNQYLEKKKGINRTISKKPKVYKEITDLINDFESVKFTFSPRERNKIADFLSSSNHLQGQARHLQYIEDNSKDYDSEVFSKLYHIKSQKVTSKTSLKRPVTLTEVTIHNGNYILNFLHLDTKTGNFLFSSRKLKLKIKYNIIAHNIYKELESINPKKYNNLIINGSIAENIHFALRDYQRRGKNLQKCFLELSPIWNDIQNIELNHNGRLKIKYILNNLEETCKNSPIMIKDKSYISSFIQLVTTIKDKVQDKFLSFKEKKMKI